MDIGTIAEVDDESVGPMEGFDRREMLGFQSLNGGINAVLAAHHIADCAPSAGAAAERRRDRG